MLILKSTPAQKGHFSYFISLIFFYKSSRPPFFVIIILQKVRKGNLRNKFGLFFVAKKLKRKLSAVDLKIIIIMSKGIFRIYSRNGCCWIVRWLCLPLAHHSLSVTCFSVQNSEVNLVIVLIMRNCHRISMLIVE